MRFNGGQLRVHRFATADIFQFRLAQLAICGFAQVVQLFSFELAHFARFNVEHQRAVAYATNLLDVVADLLEHLTQLAVAAFNEDDFVPGVVALANLANLGGRSLHPAGTRSAALDSHARTEAVQLFVAWFTAHLYEVSLFHSGCGAREFVGEVAVVGDEQEAFAQVVQASDGVEPLAQLCEELHHGRAPLGIAHRGYKAPGLVEHEVSEALGALQQFAIDADVVTGGVGFGTEFGNDFAVHLYAARRDQIFSGTAAGNSSLGQDFLQTLKLAWYFWLGDGIDFLVGFRGSFSGSFVVFDDGF
jgi:hypothetical protein